MNAIYFDPLDTRSKSVIGAVATGEELTLNLFSEENSENAFLNGKNR